MGIAARSMLAPTPLACAIWRTPSARPSLRSTHADAARLRPSSKPRRTRGSKYQRRIHPSGAVVDPPSALATRPCFNWCSPAATPLFNRAARTQLVAGPRAAARPGACRRLTVPTAVTSTTIGPGELVRLPPATCRRYCAASAARPDARSSNSSHVSAGEARATTAPVAVPHPWRPDRSGRRREPSDRSPPQAWTG